jgi:ADYC domain
MMARPRTTAPGCYTLALLLILALPARPDEPAADAFPKLRVVGTEFRITMADGRELAGADLVGAILNFGDATGDRLPVRIEAVRPDPKDPSGETLLYTYTVEHPLTRARHNPCAPDADGLAMGFPLSGIWTATGEHLPSEDAFSLTCTSGATAKCVRMGYKPWKTADNGTPLWLYHQACVRMVRADYCGDGRGHTREGVQINVYDRLAIQVADPSPTMTFEAAWGADGAVCVHKVRVPEAVSLDSLVRACPERLAGKIGPDCTEKAALRSDDALIMNASGSPQTGG